MLKKILGVLLSASLCLSCVACGDSKDKQNGGAKYELAVVTDANSIDDRGFNQGAWEGLSKYAEENKISHQYYRPIDQSTDGYLVAIESAVNNGAKLVVCPGFLFEPAIFQAQDKWPDVKFIILDGVPQDGTYTTYKTADNTYSIVFAEEQSGFLAGYATVKEGYRQLGFFGAMAVPAVKRYGYGFLQGADYAAKELGLSANDITCKYLYTGTFDILPENQTKAASWYQSGTEAIFGCGTPDNVFAACESVGGNKVSIGVDVDQSASSDTVMTSAMKNLSLAVYDGVKKYYNNEFPGGKNVTLTINEDALELPMDTSRFKKFTKEDYDKIVADMKADKDGMVSSMIRDVDKDGNVIDTAKVAENCKNIKVVEIS